MTLIQLPAHLQASWDAVGGLSRPSKMPCHAWGIPASTCRLGARLAEQPGTVCHSCYALKGRFHQPNVQQAYQRRFDCYEADPIIWLVSMIRLLNALERPPLGSGYFRWFDSGDLQGAPMLNHIIEIADMTPDISHWLPTREVRTVTGVVQRQTNWGYSLPPNLTIRTSANKVNPRPDRMGPGKHGLPRSSVVTDKDLVTCPARNHGNACNECRDCWDKDIPLVTYELH